MWFVNTFFKKNCTIRKTLTQIKPIMLDKFKGLGWKKYYLIFGMCDETFSVNYTSEIPEDVDRGWFYFFVTLLNQFYWIASATIGGIIGSLRSGFLYDSDNDTDCTSLTVLRKWLEQWQRAIFLSLFLKKIKRHRNISSILVNFFLLLFSEC